MLIRRRKKDTVTKKEYQLGIVAGAAIGFSLGLIFSELFHLISEKNTKKTFVFEMPKKKGPKVIHLKK